jgi:hypothetical protein
VRRGVRVGSEPGLVHALYCLFMYCGFMGLAARRAPGHAESAARSYFKQFRVRGKPVAASESVISISQIHARWLFARRRPSLGSLGSAPRFSLCWLLLQPCIAERPAGLMMMSSRAAATSGRSKQPRGVGASYCTSPRARRPPPAAVAARCCSQQATDPADSGCLSY